MKTKPKSNHSLASVLMKMILIMMLGLGVWLAYEVFYLQPADDWFEVKAKTSSSVNLPKDDAPHLAKMEWWYYNGHLWTESGKQFSFHYTTFMVTELVSHLVKQVSLSDHQTGKHYTDQKRTTGGGFSSNIENGFEFLLDNWKMVGDDGNDQLIVSTPQFSFNLKLTNTIPPVFHGTDGIIFLEEAGNSYYYSRTRMDITGTIKIGNTTETVRGLSWFDHQWGDFSTNLLSWDWFSLQLDNGIDLMIYQLRDKHDKPLLYTGSITQNNVTEALLSSDFTLSQLGDQWTSKKTGYTYPIAWEIKIPKKNIHIKTRSKVENSEFDAQLTTYNHYWEGALKIEGTHTGRGFMELYGYTNKKEPNASKSKKR